MKTTVVTLTRGRTLLLLILGSMLTYGLTARVGQSATSPDRPAWVGEPLARISVHEQAQLRPSLSTFFGGAEGDAGAPKFYHHLGPSLFDQFWSVVVFPVNMFQFRLPSGRLIWATWDKNSGATAVVVPGARDSETIAATALLTHLCPQNGVVDNVISDHGRVLQTHSSCELDYSLMIFYAHGDTPDRNLTADLTKWGQASMEARQQQLGEGDLFPRLDRKLLLKRLVTVLDDHPIDLTVIDAVFPLNAHAVAAF